MSIILERQKGAKRTPLTPNSLCDILTWRGNSLLKLNVSNTDKFPTEGLFLKFCKLILPFSQAINLGVILDGSLSIKVVYNPSTPSSSLALFLFGLGVGELSPSIPIRSHHFPHLNS